MKADEISASGMTSRQRWPKRGSGRPIDFQFAQDLAYRAALAVENARAYGQVNAANRAKDDFLATLSHELRTPLNAVLGWARMLRAGTIGPAKMPRAFEVIERNATAQLDLVEDLLDLSRIITGARRCRRWRTRSST